MKYRKNILKIFFQYILTRKKNKNDMPMKLVSKPDVNIEKIL